MNRKSDICHAERNCIEIRGSESRKVYLTLHSKSSVLASFTIEKNSWFKLNFLFTF